MVEHPEPLFLNLQPGESGRRYALHHRPASGAACGLVVYVHPFAEEMNKARRMAALQSRRLAAAGFAVLQLDLLGCGDSAGDFGDATWPRWIDDVVFACHWLRARHPAAAGSAAPALWLWGLRAGSLLAVDAAARLAEPCDFVFWQPAPSGKLLLQQFLRLKLAGDLLGGQVKGAMAQMRDELAAGRHLEVAGYRLDPALCAGLEQAALAPPALSPGRVEWFEISPVDAAEPSPAAGQAASRWSGSGWTVRTHLVRGPAFWQTTEIEDAPALLDATLAALTRPRSVATDEATPATPVTPGGARAALDAAGVPRQAAAAAPAFTASSSKASNADA